MGQEQSHGWVMSHQGRYQSKSPHWTEEETEVTVALDLAHDPTQDLDDLPLAGF